MYLSQHVSVIIPAYNEVQSVGLVVSGIKALRFDGIDLIDHIVVCDNASNDGTAQVAADAGAHVVYEPRRGYGRACLSAIAALPETDVVVFIDADHSMDVTETIRLLERLARGADLVIGSRALGSSEPGALTPQQLFGNKFATWLMRAIWRKPITDLGPFRVVGAATLRRLNMEDEAYGWTVEMQAKALSLGLDVQEVPVTCKRRIGMSKISGTWRGTFGAMIGIFGTLAKIVWRQQRSRKKPALST